MSNIVKYEDFTLEDAQSAEEELERLNPSDELRKLKPGNHRMRFLPGIAGQFKPMVMVQEHWTDDVNGKRIMFVCPRAHAHRDCPECNVAARLSASENRRDNSRAYDHKPKLAVFSNVIYRPQEELGPRIYRFGKMVYDELVALRQNEDAGGNFTDITKAGFDVIITRTGTGQNDTEYKAAAAREFSPLSANEEEVKRWMAGLNDLRRKARVLDERDLENLLKGRSGDGDDRRQARGAVASGGRRASDDLVDSDAETR